MNACFSTVFSFATAIFVMSAMAPAAHAKLNLKDALNKVKEKIEEKKDKIKEKKEQIKEKKEQIKEKKCEIIGDQLDKYVSVVSKIKPLAGSKIVQHLINEAQDKYEEICPSEEGPWDNHYSEATVYECLVVDPSGNVAVGLGLDQNLNFVNTQERFKTACMRPEACFNLVSQAFTFVTFFASERCVDPNSEETLHLTDEEVAARIGQ